MEKLNIPSNITHMEFVVQALKMMQTNGIKLIYEGEINQTLTKVFAALTEKKLEDGNEDISITKKVYHVMIECLQNICKHSGSNENNMSSSNGIFMISEDDENYSVTTGNMIAVERALYLKETLDSINKLSKEEIKAAYMKQMREGSLSGSGGAGLGFLDIAKKTGNKFNYYIGELNSEFCIFVLKTTISKLY